MDKQKILKGEKVVVICDYREKEVSEYLSGLGAIVKKMNLAVGDFICSDKIAIERKSHSDFVESIINGRIFEQAKNLRDNFEKPALIIEGYSNREINENALKAAIATLITKFGISLISTKNQKDSARLIYWIAKKGQEESSNLHFVAKKKPKDLKQIQELIVSSLPGVSKVLAKRLLEHFKSIQKIFNASEEDLKKVKGIGDKLAKKIKSIIELEYSE